jgi:hypothetical protein
LNSECGAQQLLGQNSASATTHDSFAFHFTSQPGPDLDPSLRRIRIFIQPIIKNWSITQNKNFTGIEIFF